MKTINVQVPDDKAKFVKELLDNLGIEWKVLRVPADKPEAKREDRPAPPAYGLDEEARKNAAKVREESLKDVISRIEEMRKGKV